MRMQLAEHRLGIFMNQQGGSDIRTDLDFDVSFEIEDDICGQLLIKAGDGQCTLKGRVSPYSASVLLIQVLLVLADYDLEQALEYLSMCEIALQCVEILK